MGNGIQPLIVLDQPWTGETFAPPTPLDIGTIESAIVAQLAAQVTAIEVVHFPDRPANYRLTHQVGAALVAYRGADYGELLDTAAVIQERRLRFGVTLMVRDLGWTYGGENSGAGPGAYALLEAVRVALTGLAIPGCRKLFPVSERFVERDPQGAVWIYEITFGVITMALEGAPNLNLPILIKAVAQEEAAVTAISVFAAPYTVNQNGEVQLGRGNVSDLSITSTAGTVYSSTSDYAVDAVNGIVSALPSGAILPGASVLISYTYSDVITAGAGDSAPEA